MRGGGPIRAPAEPDDRALVALAQGGDARAFGALYERHLDAIHLYIRLRVGDPQLAEDLTHDTFVAAYRALPAFEWQGALAPWLLRCAHNRVANHWRTRQRRPPPDPLPDDDDPRADAWLRDADQRAIERAEQWAEWRRLEAAMSGLTDLQRQVIVLRFVLERSVAETAAVLERSPSAVKNLQLAALARFRAALRPPDRASEPATAALVAAEGEPS